MLHIMYISYCIKFDKKFWGWKKLVKYVAKTLTKRIIPKYKQFSEKNPIIVVHMYICISGLKMDIITMAFVRSAQYTDTSTHPLSIQTLQQHLNTHNQQYCKVGSIHM